MRAQHGSYVPIVGVRTLAQLKDNLGAIDFRLSAEQLERLDKLSAISMDYPHNVLERIASTTKGAKLSKQESH